MGRQNSHLTFVLFLLRLISVAEEAKDVKDDTIAAIFYHKYYPDTYHSKKTKFISRLIFWVGGGWVIPSGYSYL